MSPVVRHRPRSLWLVTLLAGASFAAGCVTELADADSETSDTTTETGEQWEPIPARGNIALTEVVVNQAVDVPIAVDGVWVGPEDRNTYVVSNRDTLLRGFWEIPEDWQPREITAVLEIDYPDGTSDTFSDTKLIDAPSFPGNLDRGFVFPLLAAQFPPGVAYHMSLWEAGPGAEDLPESTTVIESPIGGPQLVGAQPEPLELKVVMIPVVYDDGMGCQTDTSVDIDAEQEMNFINYLHEQYPIQELVWEFRRGEPIVVDGALSSLAELWEPLQAARTADNADPNYYYYAIVDVCDGGVDGAAGIAPGLASDSKTAGFERVSSGVWLGGAVYSYHTMVHELGHNHGRAHVFCAGGEAAGTDPSYPHDNGVIGGWGFGIRNFNLHSPTATYDIMTYCDPSWVSDWGWSKVFLRIRTLTSWDYEGAPAGDEPQGEVLVGLLFEDGTERWWTTPGAREPEHFGSGESIRFDYGDAAIESPTNVQTLDDGTTMITTMVPRPFVKFEAVSRIDHGLARAIDPDVGQRVHARP